MDRDKIILKLGEKYQEAPSWRGTTRGHILELFTNKDGGTWSLVVSQPNGIACLVASGEGWRDLPREEPESET